MTKYRIVKIKNIFYPYRIEILTKGRLSNEPIWNEVDCTSYLWVAKKRLNRFLDAKKVPPAKVVYEIEV